MGETTNRQENLVTTITHKGYRIDIDETGTVSLYSPNGKFLEFVDSDEDAWWRIDNRWEAK